jgi:hypothetical protein
LWNPIELFMSANKEEAVDGIWNNNGAGYGVAIVRRRDKDEEEGEKQHKRMLWSLS